MIYLICYDIEEDKKRKKISDRLIADGLERIQYSVFMGVLNKSLLESLKIWLKSKIAEPKSENDSVIILQLFPQQIQKMLILGEKEVDKMELSGQKNTLFL